MNQNNAVIAHNRINSRRQPVIRDTPARHSATDRVRGGHVWTANQPASTEIIPARVVFLTHYIPLYQVRVLQAIAQRVQDFHVLLSTHIEPNRDFQVDWGGLDVSVQKTVTIRRRWKQKLADSHASFVDPLYVHFPRDTSSRLSKLRPDIVMSLELGARSLGAVRYCQNHPETKSILCTYMSEHTETNRGWMRKLLRRQLIQRADAITYNGPSCHRYLRQLGADPSRLYRLPYAADDRTLCRPPDDSNDSRKRSRLLYVGQLCARKGVVPMINQLAAYCNRYPQRVIELRLAGDGPLQSEIQGFERPPNLTMKLLGNLPPLALANEMKQCGASIAPTLADEWLMVVNEALHAGLPVIGSIYAQATTTLIRNGVNGWQYDPCDNASLAIALDQYFGLSSADVELMQRRCQESIAHCTPNWAAEGVISAIADLVGVSKKITGGDVT
ncbi:MAG: glycosyltransferase family 4 protein [Planctomycetales bacterium]|nr:glycosyltransferase family 4 protein [Planctomycetales bacterium]